MTNCHERVRRLTKNKVFKSRSWGEHRMASNAGNNESSFMKSLFFGQIREEFIFPYPKVKAEMTENVSMILDAIDKFGKDVVKSAEWDEKGAMPREVVQAMAELGLTGLAVPE